MSLKLWVNGLKGKMHSCNQNNKLKWDKIQKEKTLNESKKRVREEKGKK